MSEQNEDAGIEDLINAVSNMDKPDHDLSKVPGISDGKIKCICDKWKNATELEQIHTGVVGALSNVCRDCAEGLKHDREMSRIVCVKCKTVVARIQPHRDPDGFRFMPNASYHIAQCAHCVPGLESSDIIEKLAHQRNK